MFDAGMSATLACRIGSYQLLLIAVGLLEAAVLHMDAAPQKAAASSLGASRRRRATRPSRCADHGGRRCAASSPYLIGIASWVLFYTGTNTLLYFIQAELVNATFTSRDARTSFSKR